MKILKSDFHIVCKKKLTPPYLHVCLITTVSQVKYVLNAHIILPYLDSSTVVSRVKYIMRR